MARLGYLLPTRERIMEGSLRPASLLALAERAEALGFDSVWVGDSLLARPRHDALTLLTAVAARTRKVELGTAVLLPALRNPVLLAHQVATLDRVAEGRLILGVGIATDVPNIRAEFEAAGVPFDKRVGRMIEGLALCRALWTGKPVDWNGRWKVQGGVLGPTPHRPGGPPIWVAGAVAAARERTGRLSTAGSPTRPRRGVCRAMGRSAGGGARRRAAIRPRSPAPCTSPWRSTTTRPAPMPGSTPISSNITACGPTVTRKRQMCFAGPAAGAAAWLKSYADAGASHLVLRFAGDPERQMETAARMRQELGW